MFGGTATSDIYTPGSQLGSGTDDLTFASGEELIHFMNLAPIIDTVAGPLTVNGTNASNAINYMGATAFSPFISNNPFVYAIVSIDSYEPIKFSNKTTLTINGLAGDDTINLNNPGTPTNLTDIFVNGDDPLPATRSSSTAPAGTTRSTTAPRPPSAQAPYK